MTKSKFSTFKAALVLPALLLLSCEEEQECDAVCEIRKADFERLTNVVTYRNEIISGAIYFFASKTAAGATASYKPWNEFGQQRVEAELSPEEWLDFIKTLYKYLDKDLNEFGGKDNFCYGYLNSCERKFAILYSDTLNGIVEDKAWDAKPTNWDKVEETIDGMLSTIRKRAGLPIEAKLKAEYQKKFGEPITDIELSTSGVEFIFASKKDYKNCFSVYANRKSSGTLYCPSIYFGDIMYARSIEKAEFDIGEWLDFIRALHKIGIGEWEGKYGEETSKYKDKWVLKIYYSDKAMFKLFEGYDAYPPNWGEFRKIMDDMKAKVEAKAKAKARKKGGK